MHPGSRRGLAQAAGRPGCPAFQRRPCTGRVERREILPAWRGRWQPDLRELLRSAGLIHLEGCGAHENPGGLDALTGTGVASSHWHQGASGVENRDRPETGKVSLLHCHSCVYAGGHQPIPGCASK